MNRRASLGIAVLVAACTGTTQPAPPAAGDTVEILQVLDGDSLLVDLGKTEAEVRLLGINTPERDECFDAEARARTTELVGNAVRLTGEDSDRFGRLLRYAYTADGMLINEQLVADGMALALTTDHPLLRDFKAAEAEAFEARIGRWQLDACGPAPQEPIEIEDLQPDAPGDDARNANGEWIDIANRGGDPVSLERWVVRDESSSHRFVFPNGFTLGAGDEVRIFSGCGEDGAGELYWCDGDPVWSNRGDTAYLLDPVGNVVDRTAF